MAPSTADYEQLKDKLKLRLADWLNRASRNGQGEALNREMIATHVRQLLETARVLTSSFLLWSSTARR